MKLDLWQFDKGAMDRVTRELPDNILREQADILADKTGGAVYGRVINRKFAPQDKSVKYNLATTFEVVVPQLDNYSYTLLVLYSRAECDYPVAVTVGKDMIDDAELFEPQYICQNRETFIQALKDILSSEEINKNISILYAKACS